jgi:hypothetical protein
MIRVVGDVAPERVAQLAHAERLATLEEVIRWADILDVIVQDEFTHDVIARRGDTFLVFDTT